MSKDKETKNTPARPVLDAFEDYRAYLKDMISYLKATQPQFSYRYFSRIAGFSSPNFLKLVAEGKRNISPKSISKFAKGLGLDQREQETFETLVLLGQAQSDEERNRYYTRLRERQARTSPAVRLEHAQYRVYSLWYALPIREMLSMPHFKEDPSWIGKQLRPQVSATDVQRALALLEEVGLVRRDEEGKLQPSTGTLTTGPKVRSLAVRNFHRSMLSLANRALDNVPIAERNVTSLTVTMTPSQYGQVCAMLEQFRREILDVTERSAQEGEAELVYHFGFQLIPMTRKPS